MKIKNIAVGDFVQVKKGKHLDYFKDDEICQVIDIDAGDKYGFDVLIDGQKGLDWVNHKELKKPEPQLKRLTQSVFDGLDEKWRFAAVSSVGAPFVYDYKPTGNRVRFSDDATQQKIKAGNVMRIDEYGYDTTDWQNSLIERESKELTGSELCKAMLDRGDKVVLCIVSDYEHEDDTYYDAITHCSGDYFESSLSSWRHSAIPINNQGEPLTASEVGL